MSLPTKLFLYARKSTDDRQKQVYSIEHQLMELRQLAARKNLQIVEELIERRTARVPGRPVFNDMLNRIRRGEASGILCWHPDRLARNAADGAQIMQLLDDKVLSTLEFSMFWYEPTPQGNLMLSIAFGISKYYTDSLSHNIRSTVRKRVEAGYWPHMAPLGYIFDRQTRTVVRDPSRDRLIRKAFELYATGEFTLKRLQEVMTAQGLYTRPNKNHQGKPLPRSRYHDMLRNPFYVGLVSHSGEQFDGKHEPLVTTYLFDTCQTILAQKGRYCSSTLKPFMYRGMIRCDECGGSITMEIQKGHTYLRCTKRTGDCSQRYVRQEEFIIQVNKLLHQIALPQALIDSLLLEAQQLQKQESGNLQEQLKLIQTKIDAVSVKLERLIAVFVEGTLPASQFNERKEQLLRQKRSLAERLTFLQSHRKTPLEPMIHFIRGLTEARNVIEGSDDLQKRDLLQKAGSNLKMYNGRLTWTLVGPWKYVAQTRRLAKRVHRAHVKGATRDTFNTTWCPPSSAVRLAMNDLHLFFKDQVPAVGPVAMSAPSWNRTHLGA